MWLSGEMEITSETCVFCFCPCREGDSRFHLGLWIIELYSRKWFSLLYFVCVKNVSVQHEDEHWDKKFLLFFFWVSHANVLDVINSSSRLHLCFCTLSAYWLCINHLLPYFCPISQFYFSWTLSLVLFVSWYQNVYFTVNLTNLGGNRLAL